MFGNGKQVYDHEKDGGDGKLAGCEFNFRPGATRDYVDVRIVYDGNLLRMYLAMSNDPWEECFIVRKVKIPKGFYFGITAATGDLADNHDVISFKVIDPQPMTADEKEDIGSRIELDIDAGVENEVHHDPQYAGGVSRQAEHHELPLWMTLTAIAMVGTGAGMIYYLSQRSDNIFNQKGS
jgi:lectin, mannose-binding 2